MFSSVKHAIRRGARTAALSSAASLLIAVGLAFLTVSAWFALDAVLDPVAVAGIIGGAYMGVGLIILAMASRSSKSKSHDAADSAHASAPVQADAIIQSFLTGMATGQSAAARH